MPAFPKRQWRPTAAVAGGAERSWDIWEKFGKSTGPDTQSVWNLQGFVESLFSASGTQESVADLDQDCDCRRRYQEFTIYAGFETCLQILEHYSPQEVESNSVLEYE